jgi:hypothetical protein|tara:strand:+ start:441 stop:977 length:537 start_codon:yes stop_codon:yes gene_type:complete
MNTKPNSTTLQPLSRQHSLEKEIPLKAQLKTDINLLTLEVNDTKYYVAPIENYTNYYASTSGHIISTQSGAPKVLKDRSTKGYLKVRIKQNNQTKVTEKRVHRLIASTYFEQPDTDANSFPRIQVNHIDGRTDNNKVANLEWCSPQENIDHLYQVLLADDVVRASVLKSGHQRAHNDE